MEGNVSLDVVILIRVLLGISNCGISTVDCAWHAQLGLEVGS